MAGSILIPLRAVFDNKGIKQAQSEFGKLGSSIKGLLGAAGLTVGLSGVVNVLKESATAAIGDVKSQALLANQLRNTVGASDAQIASVEASIKAMQMQAAVADDDIRPAFASLVRATGDVTSATSLTSLALDVAAGTGKDLGAVSLALGKAVNGSTTSLLKLVPSIKGASNPMGELASQFAGAAEEAANNDPIQRLTIVMGELQEQIGTYLLPSLEEFAGFLSDSQTQDSITWMIDEFGAWTKQMGLAADGVFYLGEQVTSFVEIISGGFEANPFTDFLGGIADRAYLALNPIQKLVNLLKQFGLLKTKEDSLVGGAKVSKGLTSNEKFLLEQSLKTYKEDPDPRGPSDADKKAAAAAKAAADKAAKARKAIIDAAEKAADDARKAFESIRDAALEFGDTFKEVAKSFSDAFKASAELGAFEEQAVSAFDAIKQSAIEASKAGLFDARTLDGLLAYADREKALLQGIAKQRDVLAKKISIAQAVTSGVMGSLNITAMLESETKQVTKSVTSLVNGIALTTTQTFDEVVSGGLADSFRKLVDKTKAFASNLNKLKALGLNGNLFKQIVDAGAEGGNATAEAIIAGGAEAVTELNGLFKDLSDAGNEIAKTTTPVLYALGEDITNSFIDGLRSEDQKLIDTATAMAALFTSEFKKQLDLAIAPTLQTMASTGIEAQTALDLSKRPDPKRSPQSYANWLESIGGIDPVRSPQSYANQLASTTYNTNIYANAITDQQSLPALVTNALVTANKQGLTGGLSRVLAI